MRKSYAMTAVQSNPGTSRFFVAFSCNGLKKLLLPFALFAVEPMNRNVAMVLWSFSPGLERWALGLEPRASSLGPRVLGLAPSNFMPGVLGHGNWASGVGPRPWALDFGPWASALGS